MMTPPGSTPEPVGWIRLVGLDADGEMVPVEDNGGAEMLVVDVARCRPDRLLESPLAAASRVAVHPAPLLC